MYAICTRTAVEYTPPFLDELGYGNDWIGHDGKKTPVGSSAIQVVIVHYL